MSRKTFQDLQEITDQFFQLHWNDTEYPSWSEPWNFIGTIPNGNHPGCYATFNKNEKLTYIGLGIGSAKGYYQEHGLGKRLKRFYKVDIRDYKDASNTTYHRIDEVNAYYLRTLPFKNGLFYLAAAFEIYAIVNMDGLNNTVHNKR